MGSFGHHFRRDAASLSFAVGYGVAAFGLFAAYTVRDRDDVGFLALAFAPFVVGPGLLVLLAQLVRPFWGRTRPRAGTRCEICGTHGPTTEVRALRVTGLVVGVALTQLAARTCRSCGVRAYLTAAVWSLGLGWWGVVSVFVTPGFVIHDLLMIPRVLLTTIRSSRGIAALDEQRDYALLLLARKDEATVARVIASRADVTEQDALAFVTKLASELPDRAR